MFDPAAMGTLLIGLDLAARPEPQNNGRRRKNAAPRRLPAIRVAVARGLRRAASVLERPMVGEVAK